MTKRETQFNWMAVWAAKNGLQLITKGEVGIGRDCVGVVVDGKYPDYHWYDDNYNPIDKNGTVWTPPDAYHKHPCVAVLGTGEKAEDQLYQWLCWFDNHNFKLKTGPLPIDPELGATLAFAFGKDSYARMVRQKTRRKR